MARKDMEIEMEKIREALNEAELFSRSILDSLTTNAVILDEAGNIIRVNRAWLDFALKNGVTSIDKVDTGSNYFDVCKKARGEHAEEAPAAFRGLSSLLEGKQDVFELIYPCDSPEEKRWFQLRASAFSIGEHRYAVVSHINITELKTAEEKIAEHGRKEAALREAKTQADLYVDLMGHDINNMNMVALGHLELALNKLRSGGRVDDEVIVHLSLCNTTLNNVSKLISNVKIIQQVKGGALEIRVVDIGKMLAEVVHEYRNVPGREVLINYRPVTGFYVKTCELFKDVFSNLVGNAIKHSSGALVINIEVEKVREGADNYYRIAVEDNGPGISDERKAELFKRYKVGESKAKGVGVGLILVRTLVEDFNGKIWVEDRVPGDHAKGARFVVTLPAVEK